MESSHQKQQKKKRKSPCDYGLSSGEPYKNKYQIILEPRFCSCAYFIDEVTCKHHVGACIITNHVDYSDREFVIAKGKGRPKKNAKGAQTF